MANHSFLGDFRLARRVVLAAGLGVVAQFGAGRAEASLFREQQDCLALTMYWEARGEGRDGMIAVGWTVLNRVRSPGFPATPCQVVHQGRRRTACEFSWWCDGKSDRPRDARSWRLAQSLAQQLLLRPPRDPTRGALWYHNTSIRRPWQHVRTKRIGRHIFYR
jgi:spore germination cell wall hydrolase CwlJ-like protein